MTDRELREFAQRELSNGMCDPFLWSGTTHLGMQFAVQFFEQGWQAAIKSEREAIATQVEAATLRTRQTRAWGDAKQVAPCEIAAAIRARSQG